MNIHVVRIAALVAITFGAICAISTQGAQPAKSIVWVGLRDDDRPGTGTKDDPFDASSSEKLDALMQAIEPQASIHFGAGTFSTRGIQAKEGWRISGRGKDLTTIKLADGTATAIGDTNYPVISKYFDNVWLRYFELRDLTLDCNRENQPVFARKQKGSALSAYLIAAKSAKITNVRVRGTWASPGEGFPCMVMHDGSSGNDDRVEISGVENLNPVGYLTAISVSDQHGGSISGFIRDCLVTDHKDGSAFGSGGWRNFEIANNRTRDVAIPIVIDTHNYRNVRIHGNVFRNCSAWGVLANGGGVYDRIKIYRNLFEMGPKAGPCVFTGDARITAEVWSNTLIQTGAREPIITKGPGTRATIRGNVIRRGKKSE